MVSMPAAAIPSELLHFLSSPCDTQRFSLFRPRHADEALDQYITAFRQECEAGKISGGGHSAGGAAAQHEDVQSKELPSGGVELFSMPLAAATAEELGPASALDLERLDLVFVRCVPPGLLDMAVLELGGAQLCLQVGPVLLPPDWREVWEESGLLGDGGVDVLELGYFLVSAQQLAFFTQHPAAAAAALAAGMPGIIFVPSGLAPVELRLDWCHGGTWPTIFVPVYDACGRLIGFLVICLIVLLAALLCLRLAADPACGSQLLRAYAVSKSRMWTPFLANAGRVTVVAARSGRPPSMAEECATAAGLRRLGQQRQRMSLGDAPSVTAGFGSACGDESGALAPEAEVIEVVAVTSSPSRSPRAPPLAIDTSPPAALAGPTLFDGPIPERSRPRNALERREWTTEEDDIIRSGVKQFGYRWRRIASLPQLQGRSDEAVRNRWSRLKGGGDTTTASAPEETPGLLALVDTVRAGHSSMREVLLQLLSQGAPIPEAGVTKARETLGRPDLNQGDVVVYNGAANGDKGVSYLFARCVVRPGGAVEVIASRKPRLGVKMVYSIHGLKQRARALCDAARSDNTKKAKTAPAAAAGL